MVMAQLEKQKAPINIIRSIYAYHVFTSATDIVLEPNKVTSGTLLHNYQKYSNIKSSNKIKRKSVNEWKLDLIPKVEWGLKCRIHNYQIFSLCKVTT